jgi:predicted ATPase
LKTQKIALIGGPGTGKTTLINALKTKGYNCMEEISRQITLEAQEKGIEQLFLEDPLLFRLFKKQLPRLI